MRNAGRAPSRSLLADVVSPTELENLCEKNDANAAYVQKRLDGLIRGTSYFGNNRIAAHQLHEFYKEHAKHGPPIPARAPTVTADMLGAFVNGDATKISKQDFSLLVIFLLVRGLYYSQNRGQEIAEKFPDPLYHAMLGFMDIGSITVENMKLRAPGLYRALRPSSTFPGHFWDGLLEITHDTHTGAIKTLETYRSTARHQRPPKQIVFEGYMLRKTQQYFIIARNLGVTSLQVIVLPNVTVLDTAITTMHGAVLDMATSRLYTARVFYERLEGDGRSDADRRKNALANADVRSGEEIPPSVLEYFKDEWVPRLTMF